MIFFSLKYGWSSLNNQFFSNHLNFQQCWTSEWYLWPILGSSAIAASLKSCDHNQCTKPPNCSCDLVVSHGHIIAIYNLICQQNHGGTWQETANGNYMMSSLNNLVICLTTARAELLLLKETVTWCYALVSLLSLTEDHL